ncbi:hypothetical protein AAJCM20276_31730 [Acetobacter aceti]|uniref:Uncharacterized protein n=1 Tax=Acetobacter aceti TaxID=435 RepID=A0A6S6PMA1_ACEAC|nr:hypothetical protein AAJCM20276_31730 [Acetobacter aceti]
MTRAVKLRDDYSASDLRRLAARSRQANAACRLLALAAIRDGASRTDAARVGGMDRQTLRDGCTASMPKGRMACAIISTQGRPAA